MVDIQSRAHRILKPLKNYFDLSENGKLPKFVPAGLVVDTTDKLVGLYASDLDELSDIVLFTTTSIYFWHRDQWEKVMYDEIQRTIFPPDKTIVTGFTILKKDGNEFWLPVKGVKGGRFYDAFEILRFLDRVRDDLNV
jgi:hypothetical protein